MPHSDPPSRSANAEGDAPLWPALRETTVVQVNQGRSLQCQDKVVEEVPVALVYNGISHVVLLATPEHLEDLALGFSLSEAILESPSELQDVEVQPCCQGLELRLTISPRRFATLKDRRRTLAGRTGCGLCGLESLAAFPLTEVTVCRGAPIPATAIAKALAQLPHVQQLQAASGGVHGAAWVETDGSLVEAREDVGRHNALDKLIGWQVKNADPRSGFVLVSSRASYEMVQKAATVGLGCLVAISAPTGLAISLAQRCNLCLIGFARGDRMVVYSAPEHVLTG